MKKDSYIDEKVSCTGEASGFLREKLSSVQFEYEAGRMQIRRPYLYELFRNYYAKNDLQTSGESEVHWDNISSSPTILDLANGENDRVVTAVDANSMNAEQYLTFDGKHLSVGSGAFAENDLVLTLNIDRPWKFFQSGNDATANINIGPSSDSKAFNIRAYHATPSSGHVIASFYGHSTASNVDLYYGGSKKFETTSAGATITGSVTWSGGSSANANTAYIHSQIAGGNSVHVSTTENTQWDTAYAHSQSNSQAHSDYMLNTGDTASGTYNFDSNTLVVNHSTHGIGIGTTTIPHGGVGYAKFAIEGTNANAAGPHVQFTTALDNYPVMQMLNWSHDNVSISFDAYFDGVWKSSDAGSNFQIYKGGDTADTLRIDYDSGIAQGSAITWNSGIILDIAGGVTISSMNNNNALITTDSNGKLISETTLTYSTTEFLFQRSYDGDLRYTVRNQDDMNTSARAIIVADAKDGGNIGLYACGDNYNSTFWNETGNSTVAVYGGSAADRMLIGTNWASPLMFFTNGTKRMTINGSSTKIGIGIDPQKAFHVAGTILVDGDEGGYAGTVGLVNTTANKGSGSTAVLMADETSSPVASNTVAKWWKIYIGTATYYIPLFQ